jgi:hypothetical protein
MTNYKEIIVDATTGEKTERLYTEAEIAEVEDFKNKLFIKRAAEKEAEATKATAKAALLDKLGITAEEAQLLLGGN